MVIAWTQTGVYMKSKVVVVVTSFPIVLGSYPGLDH